MHVKLLQKAAQVPNIHKSLQVKKIYCRQLNEELGNAITGFESYYFNVKLLSSILYSNPTDHKKWTSEKIVKFNLHLLQIYIYIYVQKI